MYLLQNGQGMLENKEKLFSVGMYLDQFLEKSGEPGRSNSTFPAAARDLFYCSLAFASS